MSAAAPLLERALWHPEPSMTVVMALLGVLLTWMFFLHPSTSSRSRPSSSSSSSAGSRSKTIFRRFFATSELLSTPEATLSRDKIQAEVQGYAQLFSGAREEVGKISSKVSVETRQRQYEALVDSFYNLVTDFYEYGWGQSFHFSRRFAEETFEAAIARAEHFLALKLRLSPASKVLDMGCGIGGPMRTIHRFSGAVIQGITINEYQVKVANRYNAEMGMDKHCGVVQGDFMNMPFEDNTFDAIYCIESTCHSPDKTRCFAEAMRVLKPGGLLTGYEWVMTDKYDPENLEHVRIKEGIEVGNGLPTIETGEDVNCALRKAGLDVLEAWNAAEKQSPADVAWYEPLAGKYASLGGFRMTPLGRKCTHFLVKVLEMLKIAPKGSVQVSKMLNQTADDLVRSGELDIFTPNYFFLAQKPV